MTENRELFADLARRLFSDHAGQAVVEAAEAGQFPSALWTAVAEAGLPQILVPEANGGIGADLPDACAVMQAMGAFAVPLPLLETIVARVALAQAGLESPDGPIGLCFIDASRSLENEPTVQWAGKTDAIVAIRLEEGGGRLAMIRNPLLTSRLTLSAEPGAAITLDAVDWARPVDGFEHLRLASTLNAARIVGALGWCLDASLAYARERQQFGRPIGGFQLVQNHLGGMAGHVAAASTIMEACASAEPGHSALHAACRARLGDAIDEVVASAHQVHGAIGFSREHALNFRTRRLMQWRDMFGSTPYWRSALSTGLIGRAPEQIWASLAGA